MPLFIKTPVNDEEVRALVKTHWNVELGDKLKDAQNQTYLGSMTAGSETKKVTIRVTPNPEGKRTDTIDLELSVLQFLASKHLPVCESYPTLDTGALQVPLGELSVSVFHYAQGEPIDYVKLLWMLDEEKVVGVGRWIGKLHLLLDEYEDSHPDMASKARKWDQLHDGVLKGISIDERDVKTENEKSDSKPRPYGIIHGDINPSNYFWIPELELPSMFDWDQMQRAWRLYDLAANIWSVITLQHAGSPVTLQPVPEADEAKFTDMYIRGYEEVTSTKVDREALARQIHIRRQLYTIFCSRALAELEPGSFMYNFCSFMTNWLSSEESGKK